VLTSPLFFRLQVAPRLLLPCIAGHSYFCHRRCFQVSSRLLPCPVDGNVEDVGSNASDGRSPVLLSGVLLSLSFLASSRLVPRQLQLSSRSSRLFSRVASLLCRTCSVVGASVICEVPSALSTHASEVRQTPDYAASPTTQRRLRPLPFPPGVALPPVTGGADSHHNVTPPIPSGSTRNCKH